MRNLALVKRFIRSKRKLYEKRALYYPTGITGVEGLEIGQDVTIASEPQGETNPTVDVVIGWSYIHTNSRRVTVFLKDLSPAK